MKEIPLSEIHEGGAQIRVHENEYTISHYAELLTDGWGTFPPLAVVEIDGRFIVADGHHRLKSAIRAGLATVPVKIIGHSMEEALEHAIRANNQNGLALTLADRQNMRRRAILELPNKTATYLAKLCGCSHPTILHDMKKLEAEGTFKRPETVVHSNGRTVKAKYERMTKSTCKDLQVEMVQKKNSGANFFAPEQAVEFVTCAQCGFQTPREMLDAPDSTWEKRDFNPQTMKYEAHFCCLDCFAKWEIQNAPPETPQNAPETPAGSLVGSFTQEEANAPQEAKIWGLRRYSLELEVVEGTDDAEIADLIASAFEFFSRARINNINNINIKKNINNINNTKSTSNFVWMLRDGTTYELSQDDYNKLKSAFPEKDVDNLLRQCVLWNDFNANKRKTRKGIRAHIRGWIANSDKFNQFPNEHTGSPNVSSPYKAAQVSFEDIPY